MEVAIARSAVKIAVERHVGTYESVYTPFGQIFALTGKDLINTPYIIGVGGAIVNADNPSKILEAAKRKPTDMTFAKPINPKYLIDREYIFASMGLLSTRYPEVALGILKLEIIPPDKSEGY